MTRAEIIQGLQFTIDMFLLDPNTGETYTGPRNDMDKTTIDACKGAIELLKQEPCEDCVSRKAVLDSIMANCIWENEYNLTSSRIKKAIEDLPPVTPTHTETVTDFAERCRECGREMAEYIDRTQLETDTEWSEYYDDFISYSKSQINSLPTADVIPIPDGATNGDMLTALFGEKALITLDTHNYLKDWWDKPYKRESEE